MSPRPSPRRLASIAARCTAILDSFGFARIGPVRWDETQWAFVVDIPEAPGLPPAPGMPQRTKFLGPPAMAVLSCRRERSKALAPERRAEAGEVLGTVLDVVGAAVPLIGGLLGRR